MHWGNWQKEPEQSYIRSPGSQSTWRLSFHSLTAAPFFNCREDFYFCQVLVLWKKSSPFSCCLSITFHRKERAYLAQPLLSLGWNWIGQNRSRLGRNFGPTCAELGAVGSNWGPIWRNGIWTQVKGATCPCVRGVCKIGPVWATWPCEKNVGGSVKKWQVFSVTHCYCFCSCGHFNCAAESHTPTLGQWAHHILQGASLADRCNMIMV